MKPRLKKLLNQRAQDRLLGASAPDLAMAPMEPSIELKDAIADSVHESICTVSGEDGFLRCLYYTGGWHGDHQIVHKQRARSHGWQHDFVH